MLKHKNFRSQFLLGLFLSGLIAPLAAASKAPAAAAATAPKAVEAPKVNVINFDDWVLKTEIYSDGRTENYIQQILSLSDDKTKQLIAQVGVSVIYVKDQADPYLMLNFPLGVLLMPGAALKIDNKKIHGKDQLNMPFNYCTANGCVAMLRTDADLRKALYNQNKWFVGSRWMNGTELVVPISTKGFQEAYKELVRKGKEAQQKQVMKKK